MLDMDSSESPTHGEQERSVWNGHFACTCYHPLFVFNQFGDLERCRAASRQRPQRRRLARGAGPGRGALSGKVSRLYFRADAAFAMPGVYEYLEAKRISYAIRLPANRVLQERIGHLLKRPVGRPPKKSGGPTPASAIRLEAGPSHAGWSPRSSGTMASSYPRVGFIVTNLARPAERVVDFYNGRGTAEQWIKIL